MKTVRLPISYLLPLLSVAVWVLLIGIPATIAYWHLQHWAHGAPAVRLHRGAFVAIVRRPDFLQWSFSTAAVLKAKFLKGLNLPAFSISLLISRFSSTWPSGWHPASFTYDDWDAITWPLYCLPFWALAGAGWDALLRRRSVHVVWLVLASALCLGCAFLGIGLSLTMAPQERTDMAWTLRGFALWTVLFAAAPLGLIRKVRRR